MSISNIISSSSSSLTCSSSSSSSFTSSICASPLTDMDRRAALEQFKKDLKNICIYSRDKAPEISEELFKMAPQCLTLEEIIDSIFTVTKYSHALLLDAILHAHPEYTFSAYDSIRRAIIEDDKHVLNNGSIREMFIKAGLEADKDKFSACCDLAFRVNHPHIFQLAEKPIPTGDYTLNFLWVNLNPQDRVLNVAQNIFGEGLDPFENAPCLKDPRALRHLEASEHCLSKEDLENWKKIQNTFTYKLSVWADKQPSCQIHLWYDSALVTFKAQQQTSEMMKSIGESRGVDLQLRDIRLINMEDEIRNCLHPAAPVFFRVDLFKILITDYMLRSPKEKTKYCIVSDIDIKPMRVGKLFDRRTQRHLLSEGYVFNRVGFNNFENSFFIFNKEKEKIAITHREKMINSLAYTLGELRQWPIGTGFKFEYILGAQGAFNNYLKFLKEVGEPRDSFEATLPRKVVECPPSQFNFGGDFLDSDHRTETFRFIDKSNVPYTRKGRNYGYYEGQIPELASWKAEPLTDLSSKTSRIYQLITDYANISPFSPAAGELREVFSEQIRV